MKDTTITDIIDKYLDKLIDSGINMTPVAIEPAMLSSPQTPSEGWNKWLPVKSAVTDGDIRELESQLGHKLPYDYLAFLKHKHFYSLRIGEASFCAHPINIWREKLSKTIFDSYPVDYLLKKGFIPFADWSDWGVLCFDTNRNFLSADYPIVLWDHETPDRTETYANNFKFLLKKLDKEDQKMQEEG